MENFIQTLEDELFTENNIFVDVLRLDLAHPLLQGNKYYKLKYNLQEAKKQQKTTFLTFGGAFSNHILATSFAGKLYDFKTIGIIRGEETFPLNGTLKLAKENEMRLFYVDRSTYQQKNKPDFIEILREILEENFKNNIDFFIDFNDIYLIPEGGSNDLAVKGSAEILENEVFSKYSHVCVCAGTGGTLAGLVASKHLYQRENQQIMGISVLKNGGFLKDEVSNFLENYFLRNYIKAPFGGLGATFGDLGAVDLQLAYHFGGYAKNKPELALFIKNFTEKHQIPLEFVYTGKLFYAIFDLIKKQYFPQKARLLIIHTGGLR